MGPSVAQNTKKVTLIFHSKEFEEPKRKEGRWEGGIIVFFVLKVCSIYLPSSGGRERSKDLSHCNPKLAIAETCSC